MNTSGEALAAPRGGASPESTSRLGLRVLLASLAALFLATLFCGWYFRDTGRVGSEGAAPGLPWGLWPTSALLPLLSYWAEKARRATRARPMLLRACLGMGLLFLAGQSWNWWTLLKMETGAGVHPMYAFNFYLMTVLHALHVVGGLIYTLIAMSSVKAAMDERPLASRLHNHASYWHFLMAVWLFVLLNLLGMQVEVPEDSFLAPASVWVAGLLVLGFLAYQVQAILLLWRRGEKLFAMLALLPPMAYLHIWARAEELKTERMALRWGVLQMVLLLVLMFAGTLNLGRFAANYETIAD
jgi:cytochrome c oxidase subunit 3